MTYVHYDVTALYDVCETANGPRLLFFTSTLRSGDVNEGRWVVVDSEYHHQYFVDLYCKLMLRYFGYLLFPCPNYQPILGECFLSLPQGHIKKARGFLPFSRGVEKEHLPEIG